MGMNLFCLFRMQHMGRARYNATNSRDLSVFLLLRRAMSSFDAFDGDEAAGPWNDDSYLRYNSRLPSQRLDAFSSFAPATADAEDGDDEYGIETVEPSEGSEMFSPSPAGFGYASGSGPELPSVSSPFSMLNSDGDGYVEVGDGDEPILPAPDEMGQDEGFVLREWRRQNVILLEEKEKKEKELRSQIIAEAEAYKRAFYEKRKVHCETLKEQNREREKLFIVNQENFHANAEKQYWKSISELIPREILSIEKKGKKDQDKKPSVVIIQGPKLGKPTDLSRMRQILLKLKHSPPQHMKSPAPPETSGGGTTATNAAAMQAAPTISKETPLAPSEVQQA